MNEIGDYLTIIMSSSIVGGLLGALINHLLADRRSLNEYKREYFKILIEKRVKSYQKVEEVLGMYRPIYFLPGSVPSRYYHLVYFDKKSFEEFHNTVVEANSQILWLSNDIKQYWFELMSLHDKLSVVSFERPNLLREEAAKQYAEINEVISKITSILLKDIKTLYDFKKFI